MDIDVVLEELKEIEEVKDIPTDDKYIKLKE